MPAESTDIVEVSLGDGEVVQEVARPLVEPEFRPLTTEEDTFALAIIEYGGNLKAAYCSTFGEDVRNPTAKARELLLRPEIAARIQSLTTAVAENALISLGSHLAELAELRDLAKASGQLKTALEAERTRGVVVGFYAGKEGSGSSKKGSGDNPMIVVLNNNIDMRI